MGTIAILPEPGDDRGMTFSAVTSERKATGRTAGEALDALTSQLGPEEIGAPVIIQQFRPDNFFTAEQRERLSTLMTRWRAARDAKDELSPAEQSELERLVDEELEASAMRTSRILNSLDTTRSSRDEEMFKNIMAEVELKQHRRVFLHFVLGFVSISISLLLVISASFLIIYLGWATSSIIAILIISAIADVITLFIYRFKLSAIKLPRNLSQQREKA